VKQYDLYIFDLDGVLYRGDEVIQGTPEAIGRLKERGALTKFLTNNSSKTRRQYTDKLNALGFLATENDVYSSASATATFLKQANANSVFIVGEDGLREEIEDRGIPTDGEIADWVVVGICRSLTYELIDQAQARIRAGAKFLATNLDATYPDSGGRIRPGAGSMVAAVSTAAGKSPDVLIGKPEPTIVRQIWVDTGVSPDRTLLVGDRLDTDIQCASNAGCDSALVLTGVHSELEHLKPKPTYILNSAAEVD
jgi:4-nitrophenyl phosphatase